jgi:hypothetical protein
MAELGRGILRRGAPLALAALCLGLAASAPSLSVRLSDGLLRVTAPGFHFLEGRSLERLQDGAAMAYVFQLSISVDSNLSVRQRALERFVFSYDIWEERFSVTRTGGTRLSASHLTAPAAEGWCLDNLTLPAGGIAPDRPFWIRLEVRVDDPKDDDTLFGGTGTAFNRLIELFSRPTRGTQQRWHTEAGPLRLDNLKKARTGQASPPAALEQRL